MSQATCGIRVVGLFALCVIAWGGAETHVKDAADAIADAPSRFVSQDGELDLHAVVKHFEDLYRSTSSVSEAELTVVRPRGARALRMKTWTLGEERSLVVISAPPREEGTATLKVDRNLWNYLPRIRRTIRIPPSMMLSPWMGSDFTNDDLVKESSYSTDYTYRVVGRHKSPDGWLIEFAAKPDIVGLWERFELVVSADGELPLESRWYDRKGRLARTLVWENVKAFDGRRIPTRLTLIPTADEGHKTIMVYHTIDFDVTVPESTFSLSRLERKR